MHALSPCSGKFLSKRTSLQSRLLTGNRKRSAHARCSRTNNPCQDVSLHNSGSTGAPNVLRSHREACPTHFMSSSQCSTGGPRSDPYNEVLFPNLERAPSFSTLPRLFYSHRMDAAAGRDITTSTPKVELLMGLIDWLVAFAGRNRHKAREDTPKSRRIRASKLAHEREGITVANALISPPAAPQDYKRLATLRSKPPGEDPTAIATG